MSLVRHILGYWSFSVLNMAKKISQCLIKNVKN